MRDYPVTIEFPLHWGEMDSLGHVNNTRYFVWFESARMALFERIGLQSSGTPEVGPILAHTSCDFRYPVVYPAQIEVGTRIGRLGTTSFTMEYRVEVRGRAEAVAEGEGVIVLIDYRTGRKVPLPDRIRAKLSGLVGAQD